MTHSLSLPSAVILSDLNLSGLVPAATVCLFICVSVLLCLDQTVSLAS